jgi:hypothetical protein
MIRVLLETSDGDGRLVLEVRASSVRRAVEVAEERCASGEVSLVFPIEPEAFFVKGHVPEGELVEVVTHERFGRSG